MTHEYIKLKRKVLLSKIDKKYLKHNIFINKICAKDKIKPNSLVFITKKKYLGEKFLSNSLIITDINIKKKNVFYCKRPRLEFAKIFNKLLDKNLIILNKIKNKISKDAIISKNSLIEKNVQIGSNSKIESGSIIKQNSIIGKNCIIRSGAVIGASSFSFEREKGNIFHMPIFGGVKIDDNVIIGSNSVISRGSFNNTKIGKNTLIDTLVQIAHNCKIGRNVTITGGSNIGGSVIIEDNVMISPCSNISNNINIGKSSHVGIGSVVIKDVSKNNKVFGNPARKI